jgi:methane monooxygenase component A beta chain/propane monooxygenase small subunit
VSWTKALVHHLVTDRTYGDANRAQINAWIATWDEHARRAIEGFAPCFSSAPTCPVSFPDAAAGVWRRRDQLLAELGLSASAISREGGHG